MGLLPFFKESYFKPLGSIKEIHQAAVSCFSGFYLFFWNDLKNDFLGMVV